MKKGFYELLKSEELQEAIEQSGYTEVSEELDLTTSSRHLAEVLTEQIAQALSELTTQTQENESANDARLRRQIEVLNEVLVTARQLSQTETNTPTYLNPPSVLRALHSPDQPLSLPQIGMSQPWLFTSGKDSPGLLNELQAELSHCNHVDILMSFITMSGVRKIINILKEITAVDAEQRSQTSIRIITTTYIGATEQSAVDMLAQLPNCQVKVSLDGRRTRLHAKAWIFERDTGFGSAYVGSANLSKAALMGGLEWTVKFTEQGQKQLYQRARAHFETLWQDEEFQLYDPNNETHKAELKKALTRESGKPEYNADIITTFFDIRPKPFQQIILDQLQNERDHGRYKNLLVSATGTGKTVMAALDYRRICSQEGGQPRLLFVAHREQILQQSLQVFRHVLRDSNFGELLSGNHQPDSDSHLFATIQTLNSRDYTTRHDENYWNMVIIDECHHIEAASFQRITEALTPKYLLGLTATPERADGLNIMRHFDPRPDGSPAVQLRLWHALEQQLLAPFEYYACDDGVNYRGINWRSANERSQLDNLLSESDIRALAVLRAWQEHVNNINECRALAFCVSVQHAQFMTDYFCDKGVKAKLLTGETPQNQREQIKRELEQRDINIIVTVDLFNEGVDLPYVDTLLLLRPTQSVSLFQQQIGRGLRLFEGKESCLILDFVGQYDTNFRFDILYSAITGLSKKEVLDGVENGFSRLPPGCYLQMNRQARQQILTNLRQTINLNWSRLKQELVQYQLRHPQDEIKLTDFVNDQAIELTDIYRKGSGQTASGWTRLKRDAEIISPTFTAQETSINRRFKDVLHLDDADYIDVIRKLGQHASILTTSPQYKRALMFTYQVKGGRSIQSVAELQTELNECPELAKELTELSDALDARTNQSFYEVPGIEWTGLKLHSSYKIREILTAFEYYTEARYSPFQAGVWRDFERKIEALFVTLDKSNALHEGVEYNDYAISPELFHWQSQNTTGPSTAAGLRYIQGAEEGWQFQLFVRLNKDSPYRPCGPVEFVKHEGAAPMSITWRLAHPLPAHLFQEFSVVR